MKITVKIIKQRENLDGIDFCVRDSEGKTCIIVNCLKKESCYKFIGYFGSLGEAMYGYNKGYPVHLNQIDKDDWTLLIE